MNLKQHKKTPLKFNTCILSKFDFMIYWCSLSFWPFFCLPTYMARLNKMRLVLHVNFIINSYIKWKIAVYIETCSRFWYMCHHYYYFFRNLIDCAYQSYRACQWFHSIRLCDRFFLDRKGITAARIYFWFD